MKTIVNIFLTVCIIAFTYGFVQADSVTTANFEVYDATGFFLGYSSSGPDRESNMLPAIYLPSISKFYLAWPDGTAAGLTEVYYVTSDCTGTDMYDNTHIGLGTGEYYIFSWGNQAYVFSNAVTSVTVQSSKVCYPYQNCACHPIGGPWTSDFRKLEPITLPFSVPLAVPLKYKMPGKTPANIKNK